MPGVSYGYWPVLEWAWPPMLTDKPYREEGRTRAVGRGKKEIITGSGRKEPRKKERHGKRRYWTWGFASAKKNSLSKVRYIQWKKKGQQLLQWGSLPRSARRKWVKIQFRHDCMLKRKENSNSSARGISSTLREDDARLCKKERKGGKQGGWNVANEGNRLVTEGCRWRRGGKKGHLSRGGGEGGGRRCGTIKCFRGGLVGTGKKNTDDQ